MIRLGPILFTIGFLLIALAAFMFIPAAYAFASSTPGGWEFSESSLLTLAAGIILTWLFREPELRLVPRQMFVLTTITWIAVTTAAATPFILIAHISMTDAFFETMSGITTTGSTVLTGLDHTPPAILLWRSLLQWLGGIGFVVMGVAILPFLQVGGMRLFQTESSDWSEKAMPRSRQVALAFGRVYLGMTLLCTWLYWALGMDWFEAINHALTTVSTGGYSTSDASFGHFQSEALQVVAMVFMIAGSLPFVLYLRAERGDARALLMDSQVRAFALFLLTATAGLTLLLVLRHDIEPLDALLRVGFNVVSVVTTTGFASTDYAAWGGLAAVAFFYLTFVGGCSGSTSGGMKIFRFQLSMLLMRNQLKLLSYPSRMMPEHYNGRPLNDEIMRSVVGFSFAFFISIATLALFLASLDLDPITSISGAATALANVGPGLGDIIGPAGNFATLPDAAKWGLAAGMLLGRLEVMTVLVLLTRSFWRV